MEKKHKPAFAGIMILLFALVIGAIGAGCAFLVHNEGVLVFSKDGAMRAQYIAESGLAYTYHFLEKYDHVGEEIEEKIVIPIEEEGSARIYIHGQWQQEWNGWQGTIEILGTDAKTEIRRNLGADFRCYQEKEGQKVVIENVRSTR